MKSHWPKKEAEQQISMVIVFFSFQGDSPLNPLKTRCSMPWGTLWASPERSFGLSGQRWIRSRTDSPRKPGRLGQEKTARQKTPEQVASQRSGKSSQLQEEKFHWLLTPDWKSTFLFKGKEQFEQCTRFFVQMFNAPECFVWNAILWALSKRPETFLNYFSMEQSMKLWKYHDSSSIIMNNSEVPRIIMNYHEPAICHASGVLFVSCFFSHSP